MTDRELTWFIIGLVAGIIGGYAWFTLHQMPM